MTWLDIYSVYFHSLLKLFYALKHCIHNNNNNNTYTNDNVNRDLDIFTKLANF